MIVWGKFTEYMITDNNRDEITSAAAWKLSHVNLDFRYTSIRPIIANDQKPTAVVAIIFQHISPEAC